MKLSDFDFDMPNELIASRPLEVRSASRMLVAGSHSVAASSPPVEGCQAKPDGVVYKSSRKSISYYSLPFNPNLKERAKELRKAGSLPEALLWKEIKGGKINGHDFDRQKIIGNYIVDFFCPSARVIIEIDDKSHDNKREYDFARDKFFDQFNLTVIHIPASDVLKNPAAVANMLVNHPGLRPPLHRRGTADMSYPNVQTENTKFADKYFTDFIDFIRPGDVVVFNDSRVIPARFIATDLSNREFEITLHTAVGDCPGSGISHVWWGLAKKFNQLNIGDELKLSDGTKIRVRGKDDTSGLMIEFLTDDVFGVLDRVGKMPLPPYMKRDEESEDRNRYQTVYSAHVGSVAAPTAGLHFTPDILNAIRDAGAQIVNITLHVGAGTWLPVKTDDISEHKMHGEFGIITKDQADTINSARRAGGRVIAIGTTSLRLLESAAMFPSGRGVAPQVPGCRPSELPANSKLKERAKELRKAGSLPEALLWREIKNKKLNGLNFDRQKVIGNYIVDFFCPANNLVIEIDDKGTHDWKGEYDLIRDKYLKDLDLIVIRFSAKEVLKEMGKVLDILSRHPACNNRQFPSGRGVDCEQREQAGVSSPFAQTTPRGFAAPLCQRGTKNSHPDANVPNSHIVAPFCGTTDIFITPGYEFKAVDVLLTNFHLPKSTLFMLVSAFAGVPEMRAAYAHAVAERYRFFSYGDCCLLFKK